MTALPEWARAHGPVLLAARIRSRPEDFRVSERLGFEADGDGEHDLIRVEKTGTNTDWLGRQLARFAGVPARDVGYSGLKDRHAVTQQWFSVPNRQQPDWQAFELDGVRILDVRRHRRKLRRGTHRGNDFRIVLDCRPPADDSAIAARLERLAEQGVPNYFGEQRFGREAGNLRLVEDWAAGKRLARQRRSIALSTLRAFLFNQALDQRVRDGTWNTLLPGDRANLDGTASVFDVDAVDDDLRRRCAALDLHPTAELAGDSTAAGPAHWREALKAARVQAGLRSLRLPVRDLAHEIRADSIVLSFSLGRGAFATAVLRELCQWRSSST